MMILKKKEIVAASMVVLLGMAGYLNWHYTDNITVKDGESYVEAGKKLVNAEAVLKKETPLPTNVTTGDYFEKAKADREISRSESLEILNETAANESFDDEIRKKAQEKIIKTAEDVKNETEIESIAKAKGYDKICVFISEDGVNITVQKDEFSASDAVKIQEIATEQLKILPNKVKIVEVQ